MSSSLVRLRFIHFGGWIVHGRLPGGQGRHPTRPGMIFVSDYDGDADEYLAAFGLGIPAGMTWTFGSYEGFPGPLPTRPFQEYVAAGESEAMLRWAAYPGATVRDVDTALAVTGCWRELREAGPGDREIEDACRALLRSLSLAPRLQPPSLPGGIWQGLWHRPTVHGLVVAVPVDREAWATRGRDRMRAVATGDRSPFADVPGLHFVRSAMIRPRYEGGRGQAHLLVAAWFDGKPEAAARNLAAVLAGNGPRGPWADDLWDACVGYPGADHAGRLAGWLLDHRLKFSLYLDSRAGVTVGEIRDALDLRRRVEEVVARCEGRPLAEVGRALQALTAYPDDDVCPDGGDSPPLPESSSLVGR